jgi:DNA-binding NtrC family response regulator
MSRKILLVEDDSTIRSKLSDILRREGYEVEEAGDGVQALARLERSHFDLVITDFAMRRMDGLALLERLQSVSPELPLILISGYTSKATGMALVKGRAEFLRKPFKPEALTETIKRLLA